MQVPAAKFKATCLKLMDRVATTGETVVITKHGKAVAKLVAARGPGKTSSGYGCMRGSILYSAPIEQLFSTGVSWDAEVDAKR
jgi:prevent-host-death family protein